MHYKLFIFMLGLATSLASYAQQPNFPLTFKNQPEVIKKVFSNPEKYRLQIIYTEVKRDAKNKAQFITHRYRTDLNEYFYPASTVKLAACVLGLEKINRLKSKGISKETTMFHGKSRASQTEAKIDTSAYNGLPSLAQYIKKILLVSDNDAYNRIYEWIGQKEINEQMAEKGFKGVRLIHRLQMPLSPEENRHTNPVQFVDKDGNILYEESAKENKSILKAETPIFLGKGVMNDRGQIEDKPLEFTYKNAFPLEAQHDLLKRIMFPESFPTSKRFHLTKEDYDFLKKYMSMYPTESDYPSYKKDSNIFPAYCKFLYYGGDRNAELNPNLTIYNKVGDAYGFLLDNAYLVDKQTKKEILVSVSMLCNEDEIFNDDKYDYETIGFPFMKELGKLLLK